MRVTLVLLASVLGCAAGPAHDARVAHVIDGDTIELSTGQRLRYIGIDTPEMRHRVNGAWVQDPEPYAREATDANREMVNGKVVQLEYDVRTHDRYGRWLAYVFVDGTMVNEWLLREGYAQLLTIPPNVKYVERFRRAQAEARREQRGLWRR